VAEVRTYHAEVDRDGKVWRIRVPGVARTTQARTLREVEPMARDLIAIMDNVPADSFGLDVTLTLPADVQAELDRSAELREQAARSQAQAAQLARRGHGVFGTKGCRCRTSARRSECHSSGPSS
jgi:hypothetical protein